MLVRRLELVAEKVRYQRFDTFRFEEIRPRSSQGNEDLSAVSLNTSSSPDHI
jgi:hypothetical protein